MYNKLINKLIEFIINKFILSNKEVLNKMFLYVILKINSVKKFVILVDFEVDWFYVKENLY